MGKRHTYSDTTDLIKAIQPGVAHSRKEIERWLDIDYETGDHAVEVFCYRPLEEREDDPT